MSNKSPIFPMPEEPQHFSDYGFDPQFDYFQVLEEARKHKRENPARSIDALHFKLQKPISKDHHHHDYSNKNNTKFFKKNNGRKRWWKNALLFFRGKWPAKNNNKTRPNSQDDHYLGGGGGGQPIRAALSGPVYITESRSGSATPYRTTSRPSSGPLTPTTMKGEMDIPYISLRDLNMDQQPRISTGSPMPIYLVT